MYCYQNTCKVKGIDWNRFVGKLRVIDFFCGAGGFSEGFRQAGFDVIWAVDKWQPAVTTHQNNHPESTTVLGDVLKIAYLPDAEFEDLVPDSEVIIGSPPCVDFSNSNRSGKADKTLGIQLIEAYLRIVARKMYKPDSILKYWILENVANSRKYIMDSYCASDLGLSGNFELKVKFQSSHVYLAQNFGVPSKRERFLCGNFPEPKITNRTADEFIPLKYVLDSLGKPNREQIGTIADPNYELNLAASNLTDHFYIQEVAEFEWEKAKRLKQDKGYMGKMSFPENLDKPARTVMATMSFSARESMIFGFGNNKYRAPTIREVASLMSFPIDYQFYGDSISQKYHLVGNAVPPKMAYAFAIGILDQIADNQAEVNLAPRNILTSNCFFDLTGKIIPTKIERTKKFNSRFRYHIPYFIIDRFRVELSNHNSDFLTNQIEWSSEIHFSQGPDAAVFKPLIDETFFSSSELTVSTNLQNKVISILGNSLELQNNYLQPRQHRQIKKIIGPEELLAIIKETLVISKFEVLTPYVIEHKSKRINIPRLIAFGYYILECITNSLNRGKNESRN